MKTDKAEIIREIERRIENRDGYYPLQVEVITENYYYDLALTVSQEFENEIGGEPDEILSILKSRSVDVHSIMRTNEDGRMEADSPELQRMGEDINHYFEI